MFVHAGVDPGLPPAEQDLADLLLIREPFLSCTCWPHDFCVVHGHSIAMPRALSHRVGVDAGCYQHGALCAVQIVYERLRYLGVTRKEGFDWNGVLGGRSGEWTWVDAVEVSGCSQR
jgi:serine/threonine protein phosphatase 1